MLNNGNEKSLDVLLKANPVSIDPGHSTYRFHLKWSLEPKLTIIINLKYLQCEHFTTVHMRQ
jgi:hypothetical protein